MTEKLPGDFGGNWSPKIVAIVAIGLVLIGAAAYFLPLWSAQRTIAAQLIDPSAALFREVRRGQDAICGEVSGKNRFGAYPGYVRFIVTGAGLVFMDAPDDPAASKRWGSYC